MEDQARRAESGACSSAGRTIFSAEGGRSREHGPSRGGAVCGDDTCKTCGDDNTCKMEENDEKMFVLAKKSPFFSSV